MKFTCNKQELLNAIRYVDRITSHRTSLKILNNIHIKIEEQMLVMRGNDMEVSIEVYISIQNIENIEHCHECLIHSKTFLDIISKTDDEFIHISVGIDKKIIIQGLKTIFRILGQNVEGYPLFPTIESGYCINIESSKLLDLFAHSFFSITNDDTKQSINGLNIRIENNQLLFLGTDGFHLSRKACNLDDNYENLSIVIPYKACNNFYKVVQNQDPNKGISFKLSKNQVSIQIERLTIISRTIQVEYPDHRLIIHENDRYSLNFQIVKHDLLALLERAEIIALSTKNIVRLYFDENTITIKASSPQIGEFIESIDYSPIKGNFSNRYIVLNVKILIDIIRHVDSTDVAIFFDEEATYFNIQQYNSDEKSNFVSVMMAIKGVEFYEQ